MPVILGTYYPIRRIIFFLGEGILIFIAIGTIEFSLSGNSISSQEAWLSLLRAGIVTGIFQLCLYFFDLYDLDVYSSFRDTATQMTQAFGVGCIILAVIYYLFPAIIITTKLFGLGYLLVCLLLAGWRFFYILALSRKAFSQPILILGTGKLAENIKKQVVDKLDSGYKVAAYAGKSKPEFHIGDTPFYSIDQLSDACKEYQVEKIVVALEDRRGVMPVQQLINCKLKGMNISQGVSFYEELTGRIMVETVNPDWIIYSDGFTIGRVNNFLKRMGDVFISLFGLISTCPILLVTSIIIKLESPGPIFYTQERVGRLGDSFKVVKFRSMRQDAEKEGAVWAKVNDDRATRFGSFIRKVRIDELPQLWNILKGDMSFVGPRPERSVFVERLVEKIPYYSIRHTVKPGLTGWAQIRYPYGASDEDALRKLEYDLYYLKYLSFPLDASITFQTIKTVLFKKGSR